MAIRRIHHRHRIATLASHAARPFGRRHDSPRKAAEAMITVAVEFGLSPRGSARLAAAGFQRSGGGSNKFGDLLKG